MRDECLNEHLFFSMNHARAVVATWVDDFNTVRPHSAVGYMTPAAYAATLKPQRASALRHLEKLRTNPRCFRRAKAQFSNKDSDGRRMSGGGHVTAAQDHGHAPPPEKTGICQDRRDLVGLRRLDHHSRIPVDQPHADAQVVSSEHPNPSAAMRAAPGDFVNFCGLIRPEDVECEYAFDNSRVFGIFVQGINR
jgi:hypothetical protein